MRRLSILFTILTCFSASRAAADTSVVFNEIMYHPATNEAAFEWVELRNQMAVDVDLSGWSITGGIQFTFASNTIVRGGGYKVVALAPATLAALTGSTNITGPSSVTPHNFPASRRDRREISSKCDAASFSSISGVPACAGL